MSVKADMTMRNLYRLFVLNIERSLSKMKRRKQKKAITKVPKKILPFPNCGSQDCKKSDNESSFNSMEPKNSSTPMNFRIYSLCKTKTKYKESSNHQDFKIYEEFDEYDGGD